MSMQSFSSLEAPPVQGEARFRAARRPIRRPGRPRPPAPPRPPRKRWPPYPYPTPIPYPFPSPVDPSYPPQQYGGGTGNASAGGWSPAGEPPAEPPVSQRDREHIRWVQSTLNRVLGLRLPVDGFLTPETRSALRSFQRRKGLPADGILGPETERLLAAERGRLPGSQELEFSGFDTELADESSQPGSEYIRRGQRSLNRLTNDERTKITRFRYRRKQMLPTYQTYPNGQEVSQEEQEAGRKPGVARHPRRGYVWQRGEVGEFQETPGNVQTHPTFGYVLVKEQGPAQETYEIEPEIIPPLDERKPVLDTTAVPFRWICHLDMDFGSYNARGSGTLISPRHILTAGHNLIDRDSGKVVRPKSITVTPGYNCTAGSRAPFGSAMAAKWVAHPIWTAAQSKAGGPTRSDFQFDYGLITLNRPIGDQRFAALGNKPLGFWGSRQYGFGTRLNPRNPNDLRGLPVNISGYPGDFCCLKPVTPTTSCSPQHWAGAQFRAFANITNVAPAQAPRFMLYNLDTYGGHSGAPVWLRWQDFRNLIAIHTGPGWVVDPAERRRSNRGVRITQEVLNQVQAWMR